MRRPYSSADVVKVLLLHGFVFVSLRGLHATLRRGSSVVAVPVGRKELKPGTIRSIIRQSGLGEDAFGPGRDRDAV